MLRKTTAIAIFLLIYASQLHAKSNDGILAGSFLRMGLAARALAMGNTFTAIANSPEAAYYNPAGLPFLQTRQMIASYRFLSLDRKLGYVGYAQNIKPKIDPNSNERPFNAGLAFSWIYGGTDQIDGRDFDGRHTEYLSNSENAFSFSFAVSPVSMIGIGLTAKVLYNRIPELREDDSPLSDLTLGMDFGLIVKPTSFLSLGVMVKDLNAKYDLKTDKYYEKDIDKIDRFPRTLRGGIAVNWPYQWLTVAVDVEDNNQQAARLHIGCESWYLPNLPVRIGLNNGNLTGGAGYVFKLFNRNVQVQYAIVTNDYDIELEHEFSWLFEL
jgi:hypothetical protein